MTDTLASLDKANHALAIGKRIDRLDRHVAELAAFPDHVQRLGALATTVSCHVRLSFPFGGEEIEISGKRAAALLEAVAVIAGEERRSLVADLAALGYAHSPATTGPRPESEN